MKLWSGRFGKETDALVNDFNASIQFDQRLYKEDITGSMAHAKMLGACGIISAEDTEAIVNGLQGILEDVEGGWKLSYEESELTGLQGVHTTFLIQGDQVTLTRTGRLNSEMVFRVGEPHDCLYQMEFGALLMSVCATQVYYDITPEGGFIDLVYNIEIEQAEAGVIDYHLDIRAADE